jgi:hypothetical protein
MMPGKTFTDEDARLVAKCIGRRSIPVSTARQRLIDRGLAHGQTHAADLLLRADAWGVLERLGPLPISEGPPRHRNAPSEPTVCATGAEPKPPFGVPQPSPPMVHLFGPEGEVVVADGEQQAIIAKWRADRGQRRLDALRADLALLEST